MTSKQLVDSFNDMLKPSQVQTALGRMLDSRDITASMGQGRQRGRYVYET